MTPQIRALLRFECERAHGSSTHAPRPRCRRSIARSLVAAEIMGAIYFEILRRIERSGYDVFSGRIRVPRPHARGDRAPRRGWRRCSARSLRRSSPLGPRRPAPALTPCDVSRRRRRLRRPERGGDALAERGGACSCSRRARPLAAAPRRSPILPPASASTTDSTCSLAATTRRSGSCG